MKSAFRQRKGGTVRSHRTFETSKSSRDLLSGEGKGYISRPSPFEGALEGNRTEEKAGKRWAAGVRLRPHPKVGNAVEARTAGPRLRHWEKFWGRGGAERGKKPEKAERNPIQISSTGIQ